MTRSSRALFVCAALAAASGSGFVGGVVVYRHDLPPMPFVRNLVVKVRAERRDTGSGPRRILDTTLLAVEARSYPFETRPADGRGGGGITVYGDDVIGVTKQGQFFVFSPDATFRRIDLPLTTNVADLSALPLDMAALEQAGIDTKDLLRRGLDPGNPSAWNLRSFRFMDVAVKEHASATHLFVVYSYWHPDRQCKATRVARLISESFAAVLAGTTAVVPEWEVIFESKPCLPFSYRNNSPFQSPNTGARLGFLGADRLLIALGDHHMDSFNNAVDEAGDYGKLLELDLNTLATSVYASGMRNPQGLFVDDDGTVWQTEHGPRGGDELNRLVRGTDYGWPGVTYGAQYDAHEWPPNRVQGHHEHFQPPVFAWLPSIGISNLLRIRGFSERWDGDWLVSSLKAGSLYRVRADAERAAFVEHIAVGERIRDLDQLPDGTIVLWTDSRRVITLRPGPLTAARADGETAGAADPHGVLAACAECHSLSAHASRSDAPPLWGVYGRAIASTPFPSYSNALRNRSGKWDEKALKAFLRNPQEFAPGSTMPATGLLTDAALDAVIAHLRTLR